ncbi:MAG: hypothetical protein EOP48_34575, partial [Sphingobacteriales bacterium]
MEAIQPAVAEITVAYINKQKASERPTINSSSDAHHYLIKGFNHNTIALQEQFVALYLNRANQVLGQTPNRFSDSQTADAFFDFDK